MINENDDNQQIKNNQQNKLAADVFNIIIHLLLSTITYQ